MSRPNEGRLKKRLFFLRMVSVGLVGVILLLGFSVWGVYFKYRETKEKKVELQKEMSTLEAREASLKAKLANFDTERGIEEEIRSKFQVAKEGEGVILLVEPNEKSTTTSTDARSVWEKMLGWLGF